jgi:hypothetical protein
MGAERPSWLLRVRLPRSSAFSGLRVQVLSGSLPENPRATNELAGHGKKSQTPMTAVLHSVNDLPTVPAVYAMYGEESVCRLLAFMLRSFKTGKYC